MAVTWKREQEKARQGAVVEPYDIAPQSAADENTGVLG